ncbi:MAG: hypothetical protein ACW99F_16465 [Candidatus Hodarchaeales archaeon]|jgi:hypothetical protein
MSLTELWTKSPQQLRDKHIRQIITFAGSGKLRDGNDASKEFRKFLSHVPSAFLSRYSNDCLTDTFNESGLALQDIINQVGKRLGFSVKNGCYRSSSTNIGHDGLWQAPDGDAIIVEVKTTDAYRINLDTIANYRRSLIKSGEINSENSSILIVVGRDDTGGLEAQIRGSKYAWDIRLISIDALLRLMDLKEEVEHPQIVQKIRDILVPQEYTKVDGIIDIVFSAAEEVRQDETIETEKTKKKPKFIPVKFHDECIARIKPHLKSILVKRSRSTYMAPDESLAVICAVSREHKYGHDQAYWFAFHPHQKDTLINTQKAYVAFGCGSEETVLLIPFKEFQQWLNGLNITKQEDRFYWHVQIFKEDEKFIMRRKKGHSPIDLTKYLLKK